MVFKPFRVNDRLEMKYRLVFFGARNTQRKVQELTDLVGSYIVERGRKKAFSLFFLTCHQAALFAVAYSGYAKHFLIGVAEAW